MTIDERLEKLTERHEALAQSLEILADMHKTLSKQTDERFAQTLEFINRLAHIAEAHEQRLDGLENRR